MNLAADQLKLNRIQFDSKMPNENDFELRRLKFIEACAYYLRITNKSFDQMEMTQDLADLITERFKAANVEWGTGPLKYYKMLLDLGLREKLPDFDGEILDKSVVLRYNFRSLVTWEVQDKERLLALSPKSIPNDTDTNGNEVWHSPLPEPAKQQPLTPSATPHDFLIGFMVHIKPDVHLDEMIPICARDQHLLYNIFGDKWNSPVIINAYTAVKGQTGFMHNWLSNHNNTQ